MSQSHDHNNPSWKENLEISTSNAELVIIICTCIYFSIFTPISLYYANLLWKFNQENIPFIVNRHARLVIITVIGWNLYPTIVRPFCDLNHLKDHQQHTTEWSVEHIILFQSIQILSALICIRLWLLYYDYLHGMHIVNSKWKLTMTKQKLHPNNTYWTLKYRFFGNAKIISIIGMSIAVIIIAIIVLSNMCSVYQLLSRWPTPNIIIT